MKQIFKIGAIALFAISSLIAQQGKYVRKSVSSLESVWFKDGSLGDLKFDTKTFNKFIDFYVEVKRFDYNVLPKNLIQEFNNQANALAIINEEELAKTLENSVINKIVEILNDPEVMNNRGTALKNESDFQKFAATKAKSLGLTSEELKVLLNSAYIYLPFITSAKTEGSDVKIEGGIIWWKVVVSGDGTSKVEKVLTATTKSQTGPDMYATLTGEAEYTKFKFGDEVWNTTTEQWKQNSAMLAFAKNLGVKTKKIDDFKLTAQIAEKDGSTYRFPLGFREGVNLDDNFSLIEYEENEKGEEVAVKKGFLRVSKTGNNDVDKNDLTSAKQLFGQELSEGSIVMEYPTLGLETRINFGLGMGADIKKYHTTVPLYTTIYSGLIEEDAYIPIQILKEDATTLLGGNMIVSYNLAPIINMSQTFLDLDIGFGLPLAGIETKYGAGASYVLSSYLGATKKFSAGRSYISLGLGGGVDMLTMSGKVDFVAIGTIKTDFYGWLPNPISVPYEAEIKKEYEFFVMVPGVKLFGEYGLMINENMNIVLSGGYKLGFVPITKLLKLDGEEIDLTLKPVMDNNNKKIDYDNLKMGGLSINVGVSYALDELPFDLFGFLDPYKKY